MDDEPPPYHPIGEHPWPTTEGWVVAWWNDEYGQWSAGSVHWERDAAVARLNKSRADIPDWSWRLVRETRTYTTEEA